MNDCKEINKTKLMELVERDKPKKIRKIKAIDTDTWYRCGHCGNFIGNRSELYPELPYKFRNVPKKFCPYCGQRIDWGNEI